MMKLENIAEDLFNKLRGRFSKITVGDASGNVTDMPKLARFFDFDYTDNGKTLGTVSVNISEDPNNTEKNKLTVIFSKDFITNEDQLTQKNWYNFLKELRVFGKKRRLEFDIRDINKSNLDKRDYKFLAKNRPGEGTMTESKMYGTGRVSYQNVDNARIVVRHTENINQELAASRTQHVGSIYIESSEGERFKYPYKHLNGARAMARHVSEGGKPYDDFGNYIVSLSEELNKLRKFKTYMGRSAVMAESLAGYMDVVKERIGTVKKTIEQLQRTAYYKEAFEGFESPVMEEVPADVAENWIDQLTIRQFNEELKDVFPYIYKLVSEATKAKVLGPDDLEEAGKMKGGADDPCWKGYKMVGHKKKGGKEVPNCVPEEIELEQGFERMMGQFGEAAQTESEEGVSNCCDAPIMGEPDGNIGRCSKCKEMAEIIPAENEGKDYFIYVSKDNVSEFEQFMDSEGFNIDVPRKKVDQFIVYDYNNEDVTTKSYADQWNEKPQGVADGGKDLDEAYIKTSKDAIETLGNLRKIGKSIERGDGEYEGNLANMYVNDVYDVMSWLDNNANTSDAKFKQVIAPVIELRKKAKGMEREPGSGKDARFGNEIVNTLYPLMQWIEMNVQEAKGKDLDKDGDVDSDDYMKAKDIAIKKATGKDDEAVKEQKAPLGEFILSYYDRETGEFPKGETAVLTMVEKDYGEQFIEPAKAFIERVNQTFEQFQMRTQPQQMEPSVEFDRMRELAGLR